MLDHSTIFILYSCNEWKEYSSMHIIAASTNINDIYKEIKEEIRQGNMDYNCSTKRDGVKSFNKALENNCVSFSLLDYGYIEELKNLAVFNSRTKNKKRGDMLYV